MENETAQVEMTPQKARYLRRMRAKTDLEQIARRANCINAQREDAAKRAALHAKIESEGPKVWPVDEAALAKRKERIKIRRDQIAAANDRRLAQIEDRQRMRVGKVKW